MSNSKIAMFTPISPAKSGIADYVTNILPEMRKRFKLDLFVDDNYNTDIKSYPHAKFNRAKYNDIIYQMGNSEYHTYMIPYMINFPGLIILHDINLHCLTNAHTLALGKAREYLDILYHDYGHGSELILKLIRDNKIIGPFYNIYVNKYYIDNTDRIICHSEFGREMVGEHASVARLPHRQLSIPSKRYGREFVFSVFGYLHSCRNLYGVIQGLVNIMKKRGNRFQLNLIGQHDEDYIKGLKKNIQRSKLYEYIFIPGFVSEKDYCQYLADTDVVINIRNPTVGEFSATLLDAMVAGLPCIQLDIDAFRSLPDNTVYKIKDEAELSDAMDALYIDPILRKRIGEKAREYVLCNHTVEKYVDIIERNLYL